MTETPGTYAGHDGPLVDWPCQAYDQLTVAVADKAALQWENSQVWALALAEMPDLHKAVLRGTAYLTRIGSYPAAYPGVVAAWAIRQQVARPLGNSVLSTMVRRGLLDQSTQGYRLTPLGADAARRLGEG